jgi:hypothetical protein
VQYQYTHEKYFRYENNIRYGHAPFNEWLDYELLDIKFDELKFYETFGGNIHGESSDGFDIAVDSFMRAELIIPKEAVTGWIDFAKDSSIDKTLYWTITTAYMGDSLAESIIAFCFEKKEGEWTHKLCSIQ